MNKNVNANKAGYKWNFKTTCGLQINKRTAFLILMLFEDFGIQIQN